MTAVVRSGTMAAMGHRGAHPDDPRLFGERALPTLRRAQEEVSWLLGRDYSIATALAAAGGRHQLDARQRMALSRATCSAAQALDRTRRRVLPEDVRGRALDVDGFNVIVPLEVALSGGPVFWCCDGALRDLAGLRGSYHLVDETAAAIDLLVRALLSIEPASVRIHLDAPVSNSGRLRERLLQATAEAPFPVEVSLPRCADPVLATCDLVATSDAAVIDAVPAWVCLSSWLVAFGVPDAWVVPLDAVYNEKAPS